MLLFGFEVITLLIDHIKVRLGGEITLDISKRLTCMTCQCLLSNHFFLINVNFIKLSVKKKKKTSLAIVMWIEVQVVCVLNVILNRI